MIKNRECRSSVARVDHRSKNSLEQVRRKCIAPSPVSELPDYLRANRRCAKRFRHMSRNCRRYSAMPSNLHDEADVPPLPLKL
jgi:hypothetical protein